MAKKLYVGNLAYSTTQEAVRELFAQAGDVADVAVKHLLVVIVFGLNDLVINPELPAKTFDDRGFGRFGIQFALQEDVQFPDAERSSVHG